MALNLLFDGTERKLKKQNVSLNNQAIYNILSTTVLSGINFLTIPIFTRILGAEQYGLYSVFHSWVTIVMCFIALKSSSGLGTAKYVFSKDYKEYKSSSLIFGLFIAVIFIMAAFFLKTPLSVIIGYPPVMVVLIFISALAFHIVEFAKGTYIYEKKAERNLVLSVSLALSSIILSLLFLKTGIFHEKYLSRVYGDLIPYLLVSTIIVILTFKAAPPKFNKVYWRYCFIMGFPIIFHSLSQDILKQSDRIMMQHMGYTGADVGIYSFFCTFTAIVNVILGALNTTWCPFYYDDLNEMAYERLKEKCKNYMELFTIVVCGFLLVSREVCYIFSNSEYWSGIDVIPLLIIGIYFIFMYQFPINFEFFNRKTKIIAVGSFSAAIVNIALNILFIPIGGMYGAALATAVSYMILFFAHFIIASHMKEMRFHIKIKSFLPGIFSVLSFSILFYMMANLWTIRWILGIVIGGFEIIKVIKRKSIF